MSLVKKQKPLDLKIVDVAGRVKHFELNEDPTPTFYAPHPQVPPIIAANFGNKMSMVGRGSVACGSWSSLVRGELRSVDPDMFAPNLKDDGAIGVGFNCIAALQLDVADIFIARHTVTGLRRLRVCYMKLARLIRRGFFWFLSGLAV